MVQAPDLRINALLEEAVALGSLRHLRQRLDPGKLTHRRWSRQRTTQEASGKCERLEPQGVQCHPRSFGGPLGESAKPSFDPDREYELCFPTSGSRTTTSTVT